MSVGQCIIVPTYLKENLNNLFPLPPAGYTDIVVLRTTASTCRLLSSGTLKRYHIFFDSEQLGDSHQLLNLFCFFFYVPFKKHLPVLQAAYPPNHYIRHVPQREMHLYTALQFLMLGVLCGFGFSPMAFLKMVFPVLLMLILPIR